MSLMSLSRPLTPRDMVRWTVHIYARYWPLWVVLAVLALLPPLLLNQAVAPLQTNALDPALWERAAQAIEQGAMPTDADVQAMTDQIVRFGLIGAGVLVVTMLFQAVLMNGAGAVMAVRAYHGQAVALADGLRLALVERLLPLLGGHLLVLVVLAGLLIASGLTILLCVGLLGLGLTTYVYLAWFPLLAPVLALERGPLSVLLRRAWHFGKRRIWLLVGAVVGFFLLRLAALLAAGLLSSLLSLLLPEAVMTLADLLLALTAQAITLPLEAIFYTLLYEDSRALLEPPALESVSGAVTAPTEPILTTADLPNLVAVSALALGALVVLYLLSQLLM